MFSIVEFPGVCASLVIALSVCVSPFFRYGPQRLFSPSLPPPQTLCTRSRWTFCECRVPDFDRRLGSKNNNRKNRTRINADLIDRPHRTRYRGRPPHSSGCHRVVGRRILHVQGARFHGFTSPKRTSISSDKQKK